MAGILNQAQLDAANTAFETAATSIFSSNEQGQANLLTLERTHTGTSVDLVVCDGFPAIREWTGSRQTKQLRAYHVNKILQDWEATIGVPVKMINGDRTGVVAESLANFVRSAVEAKEKIIWDTLLANAVTGYDGSALLANAHPNVAGSTWDNLEAAALTMALFKTAVNAMREVKDEAGRPLGIQPTDLFVGPDLEEMGKICTGSEKIFGTDNAGAIGGTVINSAVLANYIGGSVKLHVVPYITGNQWFLTDLSKSTKPMYLAMFSPLITTIIDDPKSQNVFYDKQVLYGMSMSATPTPLSWQCIHGSVT